MHEICPGLFELSDKRGVLGSPWLNGCVGHFPECSSSQQIDGDNYVQDYVPFAECLKRVTGSESRTFQVLTPFSTTAPTRSGPKIPGMVAKVFEAAIRCPAYWGAKSKWFTENPLQQTPPSPIEIEKNNTKRVESVVTITINKKADCPKNPGNITVFWHECFAFFSSTQSASHSSNEKCVVLLILSQVVTHLSSADYLESHQEVRQAACYSGLNNALFHTCLAHPDVSPSPSRTQPYPLTFSASWSTLCRIPGSEHCVRWWSPTQASSARSDPTEPPKSLVSCQSVHSGFSYVCVLVAREKSALGIFVCVVVTKNVLGTRRQLT